MVTVTPSIEEIFKSDLPCKIVRELLANPAGLSADDIVSRLSEGKDEIVSTITLLSRLGIISERRKDLSTLFTFPHRLQEMPIIRDAIKDFENHFIEVRSRNFPLNIPARFQITEALNQMILHARSTLK